MAKKRDFMQLSEMLPYPPTQRALISSAHSSAIVKFSNTYTGSFSERRKIIDVLNGISYLYLSGDSIPSDWNIEDPYSVLDFIDQDTADYESVLGDVYIPSERDIDWKHVPKHSDSVVESTKKSAESLEYKPIQEPLEAFIPTDKSDLYILPPVIPRYDPKDKVYSGIIDGLQYTIYASLPKIPTCQNQISVTTDVKMMTDVDLMKLYPNVFIKTRAEAMYEPREGITFDEKFGLILPINGFTEEQIRDNIIKYPHLFRLMKTIDGKTVSFYTTIELDGELHKLSEVWGNIPESSVIPYNREFVKEYVVRRYLLERDIYGIDHTYKMYGELDPFLTLFMPAKDYETLGYNPIMLAENCVKARVNYKKSRNPVIRRLLDA